MIHIRELAGTIGDNDSVPCRVSSTLSDVILGSTWAHNHVLNILEKGCGITICLLKDNGFSVELFSAGSSKLGDDMILKFLRNDCEESKRKIKDGATLIILRVCAGRR